VTEVSLHFALDPLGTPIVAADSGLGLLLCGCVNSSAVMGQEVSEWEVESAKSAVHVWKSDCKANRAKVLRQRPGRGDLLWRAANGGGRE
jgi:hypothetical protein